MTRTGRFLVTGGAGFIGTHMCRALADSGAEVVMLDTRPPGRAERYVLGEHAERLVEGMVLGGVEDAGLVAGAVARVAPEAIVHIGAIGSPLVLQERPDLALTVNAGGTVNVLEAARRHGVERVVAFSSIGVLPSIQYEPIDAAHPLLLAREGSGTGFYGASKVAGEAFCMAYNDAFGLDVRIVRPSAVYGMAMNFPLHVHPIVDGAVRGVPVTIPSGGALARDHTHVADVVSLTLALLDAPADVDADRIFYGATGGPLTDALEIAAVVRGLVPGASIEVVGELGPEELLQSPSRGRLSIDNAAGQLGWRPRYRSLRDGLAEYVQTLADFYAQRA